MAKEKTDCCTSGSSCCSSAHPVIIFLLGVLFGAVVVGFFFFYQVMNGADYQDAILKLKKAPVVTTPVVEVQTQDIDGTSGF